MRTSSAPSYKKYLTIYPQGVLGPQHIESRDGPPTRPRRRIRVRSRRVKPLIVRRVDELAHSIVPARPQFVIGPPRWCPLQVELVGGGPHADSLRDNLAIIVALYDVLRFSDIELGETVDRNV